MKKKEKIEYYAGIDEAGRGPVLGPMVYGIFFVPSSLKDNKYLEKKYKVKDSKKLTAVKRKDIFEKMKTDDVVKDNYILDILSADFLSCQMLKKKKVNLNTMSHNSAMKLVGEAKERIEKIGGILKQVYVDTVGPPDKYQKKLSNRFPDITFQVEKKADDKFATVSAASICAKVTRDEMIDEYCEGVGDVIGSGYPSDPHTKKYLKKVFDPVFGFNSRDVPIRFSWGTVRDLFLDHINEADVEWSDDEDEESPLVEFIKKKEKVKKKKRNTRSGRITGRKRKRGELDFSINSKTKKKRKLNQWNRKMNHLTNFDQL